MKSIASSSVFALRALGSTLAPLVASCFLVGAMAAHGQVIHYTFDEGTGSSAVNSGSAVSPDELGIGSAAGWATGLDGSAYHGASSASSYGITSGAVLDLNGATALTITGWLKTSDWGDSLNTRTILNWPGLFALRLGGVGGGSPGELRLIVDPFWNGNTLASSTGGAYQGVGDWFFFAVTWDGSGAVTDKVKFYLGTPGGAPTLVSTINRGGNSTLGTGAALTIGNISNTANFWEAFNGDIDDLRIYSTVLDNSAVNTTWAAAVPEPTSAAFLLLSAGVLVCGRRRHRRIG